MVEIPGDRFGEPVRQRAPRRPAERALGLGGIDGVAEIVTGAVVDEADLRGVARSIGAWPEPIENAAQHLDQREIGNVGARAEQVFLAGLAALAKPQQTLDMILDI